MGDVSRVGPSGTPTHPAPLRRDLGPSREELSERWVDGRREVWTSSMVESRTGAHVTSRPVPRQGLRRSPDSQGRQFKTVGSPYLGHVDPPLTPCSSNLVYEILGRVQSYPTGPTGTSTDLRSSLSPLHPPTRRLYPPGGPSSLRSTTPGHVRSLTRLPRPLFGSRGRGRTCPKGPVPVGSGGPPSTRPGSPVSSGRQGH